MEPSCSVSTRGLHDDLSLMSADQGTPGNGLLLFFRVDDFDLALWMARSRGRNRGPLQRASGRAPFDIFSSPSGLVSWTPFERAKGHPEISHPCCRSSRGSSVRFGL